MNNLEKVLDNLSERKAKLLNSVYESCIFTDIIRLVKYTEKQVENLSLGGVKNMFCNHPITKSTPWGYDVCSDCNDITGMTKDYIKNNPDLPDDYINSLKEIISNCS